MNEDPEVINTTRKSINDIKPLKNVKQLDSVQLDIGSPRLQIAMKNLGLTKESLKMPNMKVVDDITRLRFEHFQGRLLDTINKVLIERNGIKLSQYRELIRKMNMETDQKKQQKESSKKIDRTFLTSTAPQVILSPHLFSFIGCVL